MNLYLINFKYLHAIILFIGSTKDLFNQTLKPIWKSTNSRTIVCFSPIPSKRPLPYGSKRQHKRSQIESGQLLTNSLRTCRYVCFCCSRMELLSVEAESYLLMAILAPRRPKFAAQGRVARVQRD